MRHLVTATGITIASFILLAACSSRVSSIDSEKTFSNMGADERLQFCEDQDNYMRSRISDDDLKRIKCAEAASNIGSGLATDTGGARNACRQMYQTCMSLPPPVRPQSSCEDFVAKAEGCVAKAGEAEKCVEARADAMERLASRANNVCDEPSPMAPATQREGKKAEACVRLMGLCPKLFSNIAPEKGTPTTPEPTEPVNPRRR